MLQVTGIPTGATGILRPRTSADNQIIRAYEDQNRCQSAGSGVRTCTPYLLYNDNWIYVTPPITVSNASQAGKGFGDAALEINANVTVGYTPFTPQDAQKITEEKNKAKNKRIIALAGGSLAFVVILYFLLKK